MSRLSAIAAASGIILLGGLACHPRSNHEPQTWNESIDPFPDGFSLVDTHIHVKEPKEEEKKPGELPAIEKAKIAMAQANVTRAIAHTGVGMNPRPELAAAGIVECAGVGGEVDLQLIEDGLKSGGFGCIKIYLGYYFYFATDPIYQPVYELAEKYDVPVVFHTGDTVTKDGKVKYSYPMAIDEIAVDYRKVNFVIAHSGNPWVQTAAEIAYKNPNVYIEGSAMLIGDLSEYSRQQLDEYIVKPLKWAFGYIEDPSKFMFGSDYALVDIKAYAEIYKRAIPREHWDAVFRDNAVKVFKLDQLHGSKEK